MIMDFMRSSYSTSMQFDDDGHIVVPITWYEALPGAKVFPGEHRYGSDVWQPNGLVGLGPGEYWQAPKVWNNGAAPGLFRGTGSPCGPIEWFRDGCPSDAPPLQLDSRGFPVCCKVPYLTDAAGGVKAGAVQALCQPWNIILPTVSRQITRFQTSTVWNTTVNMAGTYTAQNPVATTDSITATGTGSCQQNRNTTFVLTYKVGTVVHTATLTFKWYNQSTGTGIWQVPSGALAYANELFAFRSPLV
jgi:hypothetical protein